MRNLIVADPQEITRAGILHIAPEIGGIEVGKVCTDKKSLMAELMMLPDSMVIVDYTLFDFRSVEELLIMAQRFPQSAWILFCDSLTDELLCRVATETRSFSIVLKSSPLSEILSAFMHALRGARYICPLVEERVHSYHEKLEKDDLTLTSTETEVLKAIVLGHTTKEIAAMRHLSFHTVMTHRKNIFRKLEVNNIHEATKRALRAGIVDVAEYYI